MVHIALLKPKPRIDRRRQNPPPISQAKQPSLRLRDENITKVDRNAAKWTQSARLCVKSMPLRETDDDQMSDRKWKCCVCRQQQCM